MKKLLLLPPVAIGAIYLVGALNLSRAGVDRFLDELESHTTQGNAQAYCARLHADLQVSIADHSATPPADFDGGREAFCNYVEYAIRGVDLLGISMQVKRDKITLTRSWLHPWTVQVSYHEDRITSMARIKSTLHTRGEDELTLVQTLDGVKLRRLNSRTWLVE